MKLPITFLYGNDRISFYDNAFDLISTNQASDELKETETAVYCHRVSGTQWRIVHTHYLQFSADEWSGEVYATAETDILSDIAWTFTMQGKHGKLIGNYGDMFKEYAEYAASLTDSPVLHKATYGCPTHEYFPYWRIETDITRVIAALGWQGTWQAAFEQKDEAVEWRAGQADVATRLHEGETFRLPTALLLPYTDDAVNSWRHFYMAHIMPQVKGEKPQPLLGVFNGQCDSLSSVAVNNMRLLFDENGINYDFWWFDAGWGSDGTGPHHKYNLWIFGVNFEMNRDAFPDGLRAFGDALRANGKDLMLWFEPELIRTPEEAWEGFFEAHPDFKREWILGVYRYNWAGIKLTAQMLDLGRDECRLWLEKQVFSVMDEAGVNIYRQDFNIPPATVWASADAPDRRGMTENRYCTGLMKYLSDIRAHYGDILMDTCASGGGRCDIETLRLMVPMHHSDHQDIAQDDLNGHIYMQQIVWRWFPYTKNWLSPAAMASDYGKRSVMNACLVSSTPLSQAHTIDFARMHECVDEWREIAPLFMSDYYELEKPTRNDTDIKAFMFFDKDQRRGFSMIFAPACCDKEAYTVKLRRLSADQVYTVTDKDTSEAWTATGAELCSKGIKLTVEKGQAYLLMIAERE